MCTTVARCGPSKLRFRASSAVQNCAVNHTQMLRTNGCDHRADTVRGQKRCSMLHGRYHSKRLRRIAVAGTADMRPSLSRPLRSLRSDEHRQISDELNLKELEPLSFRSSCDSTSIECSVSVHNVVRLAKRRLDGQASWLPMCLRDNEDVL
jgi:hypothetical protein